MHPRVVAQCLLALPRPWVGETGRPIRSLFREHPVAIMLMLGLAAWSGVTVYTLISWLPSYLETEIGLSDVASDAASAFISAVYIVLVFPVALLGDRIGRRRLMFAAVGMYLILAVPVFALLGTKAIIPILLSMVVLTAMQTVVDSTTTTEMTALVPTRVRYTGLALTYSVGMILGGFTPAIEESLVALTGSLLVPAFVVIAVSVILLPIIIVLPRYQAQVR